LTGTVTPETLEKADSLLKDFVKSFNRLYGDESMFYNVHLCTHLAGCVRSWGPLWSYSAFAFESGNGDLLKLNAGTRGVSSQICLKYYRMVRSVEDYLEQNIHVAVSPEVMDFCSSVLAFKYAEKSEAFDSGMKSFTSDVVRTTDAGERHLLVESGFEPVTEVNTFNRILKDGNIYCCAVYSKPVVFNDTCVRLQDDSYAIIQKIFKVKETSELRFFTNIIRVASVEHPAPHIKICSQEMYEPLEIRKMCDVKTKCLLLNVDKVTYVCDFPNFFEMH